MINASDLEDYTGSFCFDPEILKTKVKAMKPNYDERDPGTWVSFNLDDIVEGSGTEIPDLAQ